MTDNFEPDSPEVSPLEHHINKIHGEGDRSYIILPRADKRRALAEMLNCEPTDEAIDAAAELLSEEEQQAIGAKMGTWLMDRINQAMQVQSWEDDALTDNTDSAE